MLINEIPDDCLLAIFDYMNHLVDLINCYKVCVKWRNLIAKRTKKVKYLRGNYYRRGYSSDVVYSLESWSIDSRCLPKLFTNLIIADLSSKLYFEEEIFPLCFVGEFVRKQESLKGLIIPWPHPLEKYCDQLEMLSVINFNPNNLRNCSSLKQLNVRNYSLEAFKRDAHYLPNLERLKMGSKARHTHYDGPVLEKLKILELYYDEQPEIFYFSSPVKNFLGFQLMDSCPNLQSAHISMRTHSWFIDETLKHNCLQDLVIKCYGYEDDNWNNLKRLFMKYPNLKNLALRGQYIITDEHIEQLVHILPNLVLLDVRECRKVTQRAADYVKDYCKRYGRSIKFFFKGNRYETRPERPQLSNKRESVSHGFDFMKHCFFNDFDHLPHLLIPIDY